MPLLLLIYNALFSVIQTICHIPNVVDVVIFLFLYFLEYFVFGLLIIWLKVQPCLYDTHYPKITVKAETPTMEPTILLHLGDEHLIHMALTECTAPKLNAFA